MDYSSSASPRDIAQITHTHTSPTLENADVEAFVLELLSVINLWGTKADVSVVEDGLRRLVYKTYASPEDNIFIPVWRAFAPIVTQHKHLIWTIIYHCLHIMKTQPKLNENVLSSGSEQERARMIFARLSPMLILKVLPTEAFEMVTVSSNTAKTTDWKRYNLTVDRVKISDRPHDLSSELLKELLSRTDEVVSFVQGREFAEGLITKLYVMTDNETD
ncbi:hypothetical protein DFQ28_006309 [Apophysomyces sp. BC1034]|nr:hypothetical protein DFQ29_005230 [Apophysomyces sp. BC1021]KAG0187451.1 hypothetical protein DFQ28_006309 [Apophysomyces sp. BC1034]